MQAVSQNFLDYFWGNVQPVKYRVELLESSGFNFPEDVTVAASASSTKNTYRNSGLVDTFFQASNVIDGQSSEPIKYAVTDVLDGICKLDGTWCVGGEGAKFTPGWWSEVRSDGDKLFVSPPYVLVTYSPAVPANRIRVSTTTAYYGVGEVNILVKYEGTGYIDLGYFSFGTGARVIANLSTGAEAKRVENIKVFVTKTKATYDYARILEIEPILERSVETLGSLEDYCTGISIRKASGSISAYSPAGYGFGINELSFTLSREAGVTPEENQLVVVYAGYEDELLPQGVFIISEVKPGIDSWNITAHGVLSLSTYHLVPDSLYENVTVSSILKLLLGWIGISESEIIFDLTSDVTWDWYIVESGTCNDALRKAAEIFQVAIFEREDGKIIVRNNYGSPVMTITDDLIENIDSTRPKEINHVVVRYGNIKRGEADYVLSASASLAANETRTFAFGFSKSPAFETLPPFIESFKTEDNQDIFPLPTIVEWSASAYSATIKVKNNTNQAGKFTVKMWGVPLDKSSNESIYEVSNTYSIRRRGIRSQEVTIHTNSSDRAKAYGDSLLKYLQGCAGTLTVTLNRPAPHLQLRDVVTVNSTMFSISADYVIAGIELNEDNTSLTLVPKGAVI